MKDEQLIIINTLFWLQSPFAFCAKIWEGNECRPPFKKFAKDLETMRTLQDQFVLA